MSWKVPSSLLDDRELAVAAQLKRVGRFYVFLREILTELFDDEFHSELKAAYKKTCGVPPLPPALLATVTLLQAFDQVGDADAVVTAKMDKRWQLVLGTLGSNTAPFSQGALVAFRRRMIEYNLDQKLLDRTVAFAKKTGLFSSQRLRAAFDSSPLVGAGRVEDTWNLLGRAISQLLECASAITDCPEETIIAEAGLTLVNDKSVKATLDLDWDDESARNQGLTRLMQEAQALTAWVKKHATREPIEAELVQALADLDRVMEQDIEPDPDTGAPRIRKGVAKDRMPSLGDREMRHGRKSRSQKFNGYKRHIASDIDSELVLGALALPANHPEHEAAEELWAAVTRHGKCQDLFIDRGYLASSVVYRLHANGGNVYSKPWHSGSRGRFRKEEFEIKLEESEVVCPAGESAPIKQRSQTAKFPSATCKPCALRTQCTAGSGGRTITIHAQEELLIKLRAIQKTTGGRVDLRARVKVEHGLASIGQIQGKKARYKGIRKNTLDVRRCSAVHNLQAVKRWEKGSDREAAKAA